MREWSDDDGVVLRTIDCMQAGRDIAYPAERTMGKRKVVRGEVTRRTRAGHRADEGLTRPTGRITGPGV